MIPAARRFTAASPLRNAVSTKISDSTVRRLSHYLRVLEAMHLQGEATASSDALAGRAGTTAAQVRKDFSHFGSFGKRGTGYDVAALVREIRSILGLGTAWNVALIGAGRIGSALFEYGDFRSRGFRIDTVLDVDPERIGVSWGSVVIEDISELERIVREREIDIVILAVPASQAQAVADRAVEAGVRGILNFAPEQLQLPEEIALQNVNMVMELESLSFELTRAGRAPESEALAG